MPLGSPSSPRAHHEREGPLRAAPALVRARAGRVRGARHRDPWSRHRSCRARRRGRRGLVGPPETASGEQEERQHDARDLVGQSFPGEPSDGAQQGRTPARSEEPDEITLAGACEAWTPDPPPTGSTGRARKGEGVPLLVQRRERPERGGEPKAGSTLPSGSMLVNCSVLFSVDFQVRASGRGLPHNFQAVLIAATGRG